MLLTIFVASKNGKKFQIKDFEIQILRLGNNHYFTVLKVISSLSISRRFFFFLENQAAVVFVTRLDIFLI